jgi:hypothetical protein
LRFGEVVFRCEGVPIISQPASTLPPELTAPASDATTV